SYFSAPYEGDKLNDYFQFISNTDFSTLRSDLHEYMQQIICRRDQKTLTLNNEVLRSLEEVRIANFLYLNNIDYEYEPIYQYRILDANKPYTPDFKIKQGDKSSYIEHFGITESGQSNRYTQAELNKYKSRINDKILLHRSHRTDLIYTFSRYNDHRDYIDHLKEQLLQRGYTLRPKPATEVYKKLADNEENKYIFRLTLLICNFISNFKTQGYQLEQFDKFRASTKNIRTDLFLEICSICYLEYQKVLKENHCIDFQDMINESADIIHKRLISRDLLDFKYIIVDEYQDISRQRYNLIRELSQLCHAKIVAVGDDWQSIYAFSGSILPLFTRFSQEVSYAQELKITHTYRNAQEIIDIAGTFIQKNSNQIKKELISPKRISNPVIIRTYSEDPIERQKGGRYYSLAAEVEKAIEDIIKYNNQEIKHRVTSILLIGRYGFDARHLCVSSNFTYDEKTGKIYSTKYNKQVKLQFLTAHSSKGLSAENVIIINAKDEIYGFPSKVDDDPILNLVVSNDQSYNYAEERRLFYVALTRTKNRVFIITPEKRPSEFIKELLSDTQSYPNVTLKGELKVSSNELITVQNRCPICGYPMKLRWNKNYGLKLWICTNDQEICGFMTNDRRGRDLSIQKCDWCEDGFLIVKRGKKGYFLGCTNYKDDKSGCGRMLNREHYQAWGKSEFGIEDISATKPSYSKSPQIKETTTPPQMIPVEKVKKRNSSSAYPRKAENLVKYTEQFIEKDGFMVITDPEGKIITDMALLSRLRSLRYKIALKNNIPVYMIANNAVLVRLATDKPTTTEEFLAIPGIGSHRCEAYGQLFINAIKKYITNQKDD
uniref:UvrD-helicase domain-containing protein n=2 Tax=Barnesiella intestinihominis TaxID=487174 RepID=UPI003AB495AD